MEVEGKVVIITGASQGIGLAAARLFAARGAKVALAARSAAVLERVASELPDAIAVPTDMEDHNSIRGLMQSVVAHFGRIDVLVNNAGRALHMTVESVDLDKFRQALELNVLSVVAAMQEVIPVMRKQGGGVIVNISSGVSKCIIPNLAPYASTKYALNAMTLTARKELAKDNIRVSLMLPGYTATEFHSNAIGYCVEIPLPLPPADSPEHVAEKIVEAVETEAEEVYADSIRPQ